MNHNEKQADWLDTLGTAGGAVTSALSKAPGQLWDAGTQAVKNFYRHGTTVVSPAVQKAYEAAQKAKAQADTAAAATAAQNKINTDNAAAKQHGSDILTYGLGGLGAGIVLTRLQHMLSGANKQQPKYTKFGPGPKGVEEDEEIKLADESLYTKIISAPGHIVQNFSDPRNQETAKTLLMLGGTMGGLYGGYSIMSQIAEKKRKEDMQARVEEAKKEYQRALTGRKVAADLDAAFERISKSAESNVANTALWAIDKAFDPIRMAQLMPLYASAVAGSGVLSGKMMYDWTRARSKDKALAEARKARARIGGAAPIYIDPEQLAAVKRVAD
jgi:hypothetical protein